MLQRAAVLKFLAFGATIWLAALIFIRLGGPAIFSTQRYWLPAIFIFTIPASWRTVLICLPLGGASKDQAVPAVALMSIAALLPDGIAFTWFPFLYGTDPAAVHLGSAWLLWAVGVFLVVSFRIAHKARVA